MFFADYRATVLWNNIKNICDLMRIYDGSIGTTLDPSLLWLDNTFNNSSNSMELSSHGKSQQKAVTT
jgi:hypothetical protein